MSQAAMIGQLHERIRHDGRDVPTLAADIQKGDFVRFNGLWQVAATPARSLSGGCVVFNLCSLADCGMRWEYRTVCVGIRDRVVRVELSERSV
jgi:hypothetical protein